MIQLKVDFEFEGLLDPKTEDEFLELERNMLEFGGAYESIKVWDDNGTYIILDGHHRWRVIQKHPELEYEVQVIKTVNDRLSAKIWILQNALVSKTLSSIRKIEIAEELRPLYEEQAKKRQGERTDLNIVPNWSQSEKGRVREQLAKIAGVGAGTICRYEAVVKNGTPEQIEAMKSGKKSISAVYSEIKPPKPKPEPQPAQETQDNQKEEEVETEQEFTGLKGSKFPEEKQKEIIEYCRNHELEPTKDIAKKLDVSYDAVERYRNSIGQKDPSTRALFNRIAEMDAKQAIYSVDDIKPNEYTVDDGIDELNVIRDTFMKNVRWVLEKRRSVIGGNKEIVGLIASFSGDIKTLVKEAKMKGV